MIESPRDVPRGRTPGLRGSRPVRVAPLVLLALVATFSCMRVERAEAVLTDAQIETQLMDADRAFAADVAEGGVDAWVSWFTDDAARIVLDGAIARGPEKIGLLDGPLLGDASMRLEWDPTDAGVFSDRRHGFTRGRFRVLGVAAGDDAAEVVSSGHYVTVWRREGDAWRVVLDTGAPDAPATDDP